MALFAGFAVCAGVAGAAQLDGYFDALSCQLLVLSNFYHDGALHTLPLELASDFIIASDILMGMISVCCASATAVESCKTVFTLIFCIYIAEFEFIDYILILDSVKYVAYAEVILAYKLVTRIQISPRSNRHVLCS